MFPAGSNTRAIGNLLKQSRVIQGKSLREVAASANVSISYLSRLEQGAASNPSLTVIQKLERVLNIHLTTMAAHGNAPTQRDQSLSMNLPEELSQALEECEQSLVHLYRRILNAHTAQYGAPDTLGLAELLVKSLQQLDEQLVSHSYQSLEGKARQIFPYLRAPQMIPVSAYDNTSPIAPIEPESMIATPPDAEMGETPDQESSVALGKFLIEALSLG